MPLFDEEDFEYLEDELKDETVDETADEEVPSGPLDSLASIAELRKQLSSASSEAAKNRKVLEQIQAARLKLLEAPSRKEALMGLAQKLAAPRTQEDPRFYERSNLYTILRDVGEYGQERKQAEKERQAKIAALEEMGAKYGLTEAQKTQEAAMRGLTSLAQRQMMIEAQKGRPAGTSEFERLIAGLPDADQNRLREQYLDKLTTRPPKSEKTEPDPDRPSTVVLSRVAGERNRRIGSVGEKLNSVSQAQALLNAAQKGSPTASRQLDRYLAGLQGDKQLSMLEVNTIANAGSFPSRMVSSISNFLSGVPSDLSLEDKGKVLTIIEDLLAPQYNSGREGILSTFSVASDISPAAVEGVVGPKWVTSTERRRRAEEQKRLKEERERADKAGTEGSITLSGGKSGRPVK